MEVSDQIAFWSAIMSAVIACMSLIISIRAFRISKRHNTITQKPYLNFRLNTNRTERKVEFYISNRGLGPCVFTEFKYSYNGIITASAHELFNAVVMALGFNPEADFSKDYRLFSYPLQGYSLLPQEEKTLLKYRLKTDYADKYEELFEEFKKVDFAYSYRDFYDESIEDSFNYQRDFFYKN